MDTICNQKCRILKGEKIIDEILKGCSLREKLDRDKQEQNKVDIEQDRTLAICKSIQQAKPGDMVLIAGKGHEDYQLVGAKKIPFSDSKTARLALLERD